VFGKSTKRNKVKQTLGIDFNEATDLDQVIAAGQKIIEAINNGTLKL
jgi:hypothetical protein